MNAPVPYLSKLAVEIRYTSMLPCILLKTKNPGWSTGFKLESRCNKYVALQQYGPEFIPGNK